MSNPLLIFPSLSRPHWRPSQQQQQQQQPTHPPPPMQQQQQRMHHHHHLLLSTFPSQPSNQPIAHCCWLFAAGNRWRQHKLHFRRAAAAEGWMEWMGCSMSCSFPSDDGRCTHDGLEEQLRTHTSMVMAGTSNHSDAIISAITIITTITIDRTAAITRRPTPAPIWREADIAHVSRSDEEVSNVRVRACVEEAHEAVEPTMMTMTSDEAVPDVAALWMNGPSASGPSPPPRPRRRWSPTAAAAAMDVEDVMCVDVLLPHMTTMMMVVSGRRPFSSQALITRAGRYTHTQMCQKRRRKPFPCDVELLRRARDCGQH
ncbi:hypothetical protein PTSG_13084, partial [Salpingoeca rosetta]